MTWWTDARSLTQAIQDHGSPTQAARAIGGVSERQARQSWKKLQETGEIPRAASPALHSVPDQIADSAGASSKITDTSATLISRPNPRGTDISDPEDLLREHGLDPAEWHYKVSVSSWDALAGDGSVTTLSRIKIDAVKRVEVVLGFQALEGWQPPKPKRRITRSINAPRIIACFPDPHFPLHEPDLIDASVVWLDENDVDEVILLGDVSDASPFKRHTKNLRTDSTVSEYLTSTYKGLATWRAAAPDARFRMIPGNHDSWGKQRILEQFPAFYELKRPGEDYELLSLRSIFALDDLHIELVEAVGEYHDAVLQILPDLVALHGTKTGVHGAIKEQSYWESASVIQGHSHKLEITAINHRTASGGNTQRYAMNAGTMARPDLGYAPAQDVAQGWMTFSVWPCGRWTPEIASYDPVTRSTAWRDWHWEP